MWIFFLVMCINIVNGAYFTMTNIKMALALPKSSPNFNLTSAFLAKSFVVFSNSYEKNVLKFLINSTSRGKYLHISSGGDLRLSENALKNLKELTKISATLNVVDDSGKLDHTNFELELYNLQNFDCDIMAEDLCFWKNVTYRIYENTQPTTLGSFTSPIYANLCPGWKTNYALIPSGTNEFDLVPPPAVLSSGWSLRTKRALDRDLNVPRKPLSIKCTAENPRGSIREVIKHINVDILDEDDNLPKALFAEIHFNITSNTIFKGTKLTSNNFKLIDSDVFAVNNYVMSLREDHLNAFEPKCDVYEENNAGILQTIISCELIALKTVTLPNSIYFMRFQLSDVKNKQKFNSMISVPIFLHAVAQNKPKIPTLKETTNHDQIVPVYLGTNKKISVLRNSGPFARVTQPAHSGLQNLKNFAVKSEAQIFGITKTGIVYVRDVAVLQKTPKNILKVNISWERSKIVESETIRINLVEGKNCPSASWKSCAEFQDETNCTRSCAVSTGFSGENSPGTCAWIKVGYATCTPDVTNCPDGFCDSLEELNFKICPQDCTTSVNSKVNSKTRGISNARGFGVCFCDKFGGCFCKNNTTTTTIIKTGDVLLLSCDRICLLVTVAVFLVLLITATILAIFWKIYSNKKNKLGSKLESSARLPSVEILDINFKMTTSLEEREARGIVNGCSVDQNWEFCRAQLSIEQTLGKGEFGKVLKAKAYNINGRNGHTTVAVKTIKENNPKEKDLTDLTSEYQLLKKLSHPNIINLLGACTLPDGPMYLIFEFAEHGSLRNYLRRLSLQKEGISPSKAPDDVHYDEAIVSKTIPKEILDFACQICNGMIYLTNMKLVHRDLAARNILLTTCKTCKISDFGLTRHLDDVDAPLSTKTYRVPIKWMAPESLSSHNFSTKSDVWSFGVVLWELVTFGSSPYPGIPADNILGILQKGYRMERPNNCSEKLYEIMQNCWSALPENRPTFGELLERLSAINNNSKDCQNLEPIYSTVKKTTKTDKMETSTNSSDYVNMSKN